MQCARAEFQSTIEILRATAGLGNIEATISMQQRQSNTKQLRPQFQRAACPSIWFDNDPRLARDHPALQLSRRRPYLSIFCSGVCIAKHAISCVRFLSKAITWEISSQKCSLKVWKRNFLPAGLRSRIWKLEDVRVRGREKHNFLACLQKSDGCFVVKVLCEMMVLTCEMVVSLWNGIERE